MKLTVKVEKRDKVEAFVRDFEYYGRINRPFDTEDFVELENAVILSVDEAQAVLNTYAQVHSKLNAYGKAFYESLKNRTEKTEGWDG